MRPDLLGVLRTLRRGGNVRRYHTEPGIGHAQTVAEHTGQMLILLCALHPAPSQALVRAIVGHDLAEGQVGDLPAPAKWRWPDLAAAYAAAERAVMAELGLQCWLDGLSPEEHRWLEALDALECALYAAEQAQLGNAALGQVARRALERLLCHMPHCPGPARAVAAALNDQLEEALCPTIAD